MLIGLSVLLVLQTAMLFVLTVRLAPGRTRRPPVPPDLLPMADATVSVVIATLNEANRLGPCLAGLRHQGPNLREVLVVDSNSTDGTRDVIASAAANDDRVRLVPDDAPAPDWIGKVWALELGLHHAQSEWVLGLDADTVPQMGLVSAAVAAAEQHAFDVVSFAPRFIGQTAGERWVQPSMLTTLVYRCGAAGVQQPPPERVLANGQCFLARRSVLLANGGYSSARQSFSDDVTLARHLARHGVRVGFLDGSRIIDVRAYTSLGEMWREWGRSFDLKDATPVWRRWLDVMLVWSVQALPASVLVAMLLTWPVIVDEASTCVPIALILVNSVALLIRVSMLVAMRRSYAERGLPYWGSWLTDIAAAMRLTYSMVRTPRAWRGRRYSMAPHQ